AARVAAALDPREREVLAVYRRYGGRVNGSVLRLDLMARGLLVKVEQKQSSFAWARWQHNPVRPLAERGALLSEHSFRGHDSWSHYGPETDRPLPLYGLHPALAPHLEPAGPPPWVLPLAAGTPEP